MLSYFRKKAPAEQKSEWEIEEETSEDREHDSGYVENLRKNLSRLICYANSADVQLQRQVAEKLANEAVKSQRQAQIVEYGGLSLLLPLTKSSDTEVRRLAAHALANLSVHPNNQVIMARDGAIEMLVELLNFSHELTIRQSAKALANLATNFDNKRLIAEKGGVDVLIKVACHTSISVRVEAIAALGNLAVYDANEELIVEEGGLIPIIDSLKSIVVLLTTKSPVPSSNSASNASADVVMAEDLACQCARAIRNLSSQIKHRQKIVELGGLDVLTQLVRLNCSDPVISQTKRAIKAIHIEHTPANDNNNNNDVTAPENNLQHINHK